MKVISGIQQIGIGIPNVQEAFNWYRRHLGMDIKIFEEAAEAGLMLPYTGGSPHMRHAILAINMNGGGGFEIWQYTSRTPEAAKFKINLGDLGIFCTKIKSRDVNASYAFLQGKGVEMLGSVTKDPQGKDHFFIKDPYGNIFEIIQGDQWFGNGTQLTGGVAGAIVGVSDIEKSKKFYDKVLGFDTVVYEKNTTLGDLAALPGGGLTVTRVLLTHSKPRTGSFSKLMGNGTIELVKIHGRTPKKIFTDRYWGDLGFIHLCFDVAGMDTLKKECETLGYPFTVDAADSFDMGEAAGRFSYVEDPDGTLIEFVETHKVPVMKKLGIYLNLKKRDREKTLPDYMIKALKFNRVKD